MLGYILDKTSNRPNTKLSIVFRKMPKKNEVTRPICRTNLF